MRNALIGALTVGASSSVAWLLTRSWVFAQTIGISIMAFVIVWRGRHDVWRSLAAASIGAAISLVAVKVVGQFLAVPH